MFDTTDPKGLSQRIMDFVNWPKAVIEMVEPFGSDEVDDFFWYKDLDSKRGWDMEGAVPSLENTMVYFLIREGQLTVVVDKEMADAINNFIGTNPNGAGTAL